MSAVASHLAPLAQFNKDFIRMPPFRKMNLKKKVLDIYLKANLETRFSMQEDLRLRPSCF